MTLMRNLLGLRAVTPYLIALVLICIAFGWGPGPVPAAAATSAGSVLQAGGSCPLTTTQEVTAIKAWQKMIPIFRHPRCTNCHGGVPDPLASASGAMHVGVVEISSRDSLKTCEECHEEGWRTAGHLWTKMDDTEICSSMKQQFSGAQFLEHIEHDNPPFIEMAFKGRRGLNEGAGESAYEDKNGPLKADPPPGGFAQLKQMARAWVTAQGGRFVGDDDCGCILDKMEVQIKSTMVVANLGPGKVRTTITGDGKAVLRLRPDVSEPEWNVTTGPDTDHTTGTIAWTGVTVTHPMCTVEVLASPPSEVSYWLGVSYQPELKLSLQVVPTIERHETLRKCREPVTGRVISIKEPVHHIFAASWSSLHGGPGAGPMAGLGGTMPGAAPGAPAAGLDMSKLMSMKPEELEAMAARMQANPTAAGGAELGKLMNQVLPGADAMAAAARSNFRFAIPGKWCTIGTGAAYIAKCVISQNFTGSDNKGATQTITETTTITIGKPNP